MVQKLQLDINASPGRFWTRQERRLWMLTLLLGCACVYAARMSMPLCVASIGKELGWDKTDTGAVLSAFFWGYTMTQILGGYLSDRIGAARVLMTAGLGWALITFWTPFLIRSFTDKSIILTVVVISRVLLGCCQGVHYPGISSMLSRRVADEERTFTFAFTTSGSHVGSIFAGSVGSVLLDRFGWTSPFHLIGLCGMGWLLFMRYYLIAREQNKLRILSVKEDLTVEPALKDELKVPWVALFKKAAFWSIIVGHFCMNNLFFILLSWLPTYFHDTFPDAKGWVFNVTPYVFGLTGKVASGWIADRLLAQGYDKTLIRKFMAVVALCGAGGFLILLTHTTTFEGALVCMALAVGCCGFHSASILVNPQDIAPKYAGSVFGLMNTAGAIPGFVGVYIAGYMLEATGSWSSVFNMTALVSFFGCGTFLLFGTAKQIV